MFVCVHDGVRCLLSDNLVHRCYETALEFGSAIPVINSKDSVRITIERVVKLLTVLLLSWYKLRRLFIVKYYCLLYKLIIKINLLMKQLL